MNIIIFWQGMDLSFVIEPPKSTRKNNPIDIFLKMTTPDFLGFDLDDPSSVA